MTDLGLARGDIIKWSEVGEIKQRPGSLADKINTIFQK